jgi:hypothetical protein
MDLSRLVIVRFDHPTTIPLFMPGIYRWADALSAGYQSTNPILDYFRWSQDLVSQIYGMCQGMQPLTSALPQPWLPRNYFIWFTPEWHRELLRWLLTEEPSAFTVDKNVAQQTPWEFHPGMMNAEPYTTYVEPEGRAALLPGTLGSDISLPTEAPSPSKEIAERGNLRTSTGPGWRTQREFLAASVATHERLGPHYARQSRGLKWMDDILRYPGNDIEGTSTICHAEGSEGASIPQSLRSFRLVATSTEANQLTERAHVEPTRSERQPRPMILVPLALGTRRAAADTMKEGTGIEGEQTGLESPYLERLLTPGQDLVLSQKQDSHDVSSLSAELPRASALGDATGALVKLLESRRAALGAKDITLAANLPSSGGIAEPLPKGREAVAGFSRLEALASMLPNLHQLLPQTEAQGMVLSTSSQLGKSNSYRALDEAQAFGIPLIEPSAIADWAPAGHLLPQVPSDSAWGSRYAHPLDLFLVPQTSVSSWEMRPIDVMDWGEQVGYGEPAAHAVGAPSVNLAKRTGPSALALARLARPQGSSRTPPSPGAEANALSRTEQMEGAAEADPEALAREVYGIIKRRLVVEREQARGMV